MGYWVKARKDVEAVLQKFHEADWRVVNPPKYYKVECDCGVHYRWIHKTPSNPRYCNEALQWLSRQPCVKAKKETR